MIMEIQKILVFLRKGHCVSQPNLSTFRFLLLDHFSVSLLFPAVLRIFSACKSFLSNEIHAHDSHVEYLTSREMK